VPAPAADSSSEGAAAGSVTDSVSTATSASTGGVPLGTRITILGSGDILIHRELWQQALEDAGTGEGPGDFAPSLAGIADRVSSADLAVCHLEYPIAPKGQPVSFWPDMPASPREIIDGLLDTGFDTCSTASNHTLDQGFAGVESTLDALDAAGMRHAGSARSQAEADAPTLIDVRGVLVAHLSYTYGFNGIPVPDSAPYCCEYADPDVIIQDARAARDAGAAVVVVSLHHGVEGIADPTSEQVAIVEALGRSDLVDVVLGHHAHVVQPVAKVNNMWVAYGHGNLLTAQSRRDPRSGDGLLTIFTLAPDETGRMRVIEAEGIPVLNTDFPFRLHDLSSLAGERTEREESSYRRTEETVLSLDAALDGFRIATS
jgi:poly-gamma-glutamate synthesis protein (capsule biosynthesis protein)